MVMDHDLTFCIMAETPKEKEKVVVSTVLSSSYLEFRAGFCVAGFIL